ncbi:MAG: dihydroorotase [Candidatus Caenarcaniphilales bacterium]|nr:dihydroorotase [Candidatus Caenarcaniphilales bacterium]
MTKQLYDLILKDGICVLPSGIEQLDIAIKDGLIVDIGSFSSSQATRTVDCKNLHVLPGVIDSQVHFREPGMEYKEDLESGTRSAILGGVTTVFEMPNTKPPTISEEALNDKLQRAKGRAWCDHAFFIGGTLNHDIDWGSLEFLDGCCGIKIFMGSSTGNLLVSEDEALDEIFRNSRRRIAIHAEDEHILRERAHIAQEGRHPRFHPEWRNVDSALNATKRIINIARRYKHPLHVLHITTADEIEFLAQHKDIATVEVTPQHLTLTDEAYERIGTLAQMNPPIRSQQHQDGLWEGIRIGIVDVIGSDHAPHALDEKNKEYPASPSGMPGVQTMVPLMLNHVNNQKLSLQRFVDLLCSGPARIYGISRKGRIAVGYDADFTIVDLQAEKTISNSQSASKCGWTPFDGMKVKGWPQATIIRGNIVMQNDEVQGSPLGEKVSFIGA